MKLSTRTCWDYLGMGTSCLCTVHCLAMPLLLAAMPAVSLAWLHGHFVHFALAGFVLLFCALALIPGYVKHHNTAVLCGMSIGVALVLFATFCAQPLLGEAFELPIISMGNAILISTHFFNRRLICRAKH